MSNSTTRFSDRVENYIKYRPSYPPELIEYLQRELGLGPGSVVADVGSGTGIFTELLAKTGATIFAVEPNAPMREASEQLLAVHTNVRHIGGTSDATTLAEHSVDIITAAQAFHWFDPEATRDEFLRILKPSGWVVLVWNDRKIDATPFLQEYEALLQVHGTDYKDVSHAWGDASAMTKLFGTSEYGHVVFSNRQVFGLDGMLGRLLSSSYVPNDGPAKDAMIVAFTALFDRHQQGGQVVFEYDTNVYFGRMYV